LRDRHRQVSGAQLERRLGARQAVELIAFEPDAGYALEQPDRRRYRAMIGNRLLEAVRA
jgi:hypothetical protein